MPVLQTRWSVVVEEQEIGRIVFLGGLRPSDEELSERLQGAIGPDWIRHEITPISVRDVVFYLASAAELPADANRTFDIGGPDTLEYAFMMKEYAKTEGLLPRLAFSAPVTTPELAARWIALVTPIKTGLAEPLIGSLLHNTVAKERDLEEIAATTAASNSRTGSRRPSRSQLSGLRCMGRCADRKLCGFSSSRLEVRT